MSQQTNDTVLNLLLDLEAAYDSLSTRITPEITQQALRSMMDASLVLIPRIIETLKTNDEDWVFKNVVGIGQFAMTETLKSEEYRRAFALLLDDQFIDETRKIHAASMSLSVDDYRYFLLTAGTISSQRSQALLGSLDSDLMVEWGEKLQTVVEQQLREHGLFDENEEGGGC